MKPRIYRPENEDDTSYAEINVTALNRDRDELKVICQPIESTGNAPWSISGLLNGSRPAMSW